MPVRIAVDAMGSDHGPPAAVTGGLSAVRACSDIQLSLVGDGGQIEPLLSGLEDGLRGRVEVVHASQVVAMHESPVQALRSKPDSSLVRLAKLVDQGAVDAIISAGNTGAFVGVCQLLIRPLAGVPRVALSVLIPAAPGAVVFLDVGANVEPKVHHLVAYAQLGSIFAEVVLGRSRPKVGLLNVGSEPDKGTGFYRQVREALAGLPEIDFIGNLEGRDLYAGTADVVVTDGFTGNVVLKSLEGQFSSLSQVLRGAVSEASAEVGGALSRLLGELRRAHDYQEYGGAHVLGASAVCMKCHGSSDHRAFGSAVLRCAEAVRGGLLGALSSRIIEREAQTS
mgnify:CR=1 FL=1